MDPRESKATAELFNTETEPNFDASSALSLTKEREKVFRLAKKYASDTGWTGGVRFSIDGSKDKALEDFAHEKFTALQGRPTRSFNFSELVAIYEKAEMEGFDSFINYIKDREILDSRVRFVNSMTKDGWWPDVDSKIHAIGMPKDAAEEIKDSLARVEKELGTHSRTISSWYKTYDTDRHHAEFIQKEYASTYADFGRPATLDSSQVLEKSIEKEMELLKKEREEPNSPEFWLPEFSHRPFKIEPKASIDVKTLSTAVSARLEGLSILLKLNEEEMVALSRTFSSVKEFYERSRINLRAAAGQRVMNHFHDTAAKLLRETFDEYLEKFDKRDVLRQRKQFYDSSLKSIKEHKSS